MSVVTELARTATAPGLKTAANGVTVARLAATPLLVLLVLRATPSWAALLFWAALAFSDFAGRLVGQAERPERLGRLPRPAGGQVPRTRGAGRHGRSGRGDLGTRSAAGGPGSSHNLLSGSGGRRGVSVPARRVAKAKTLVEFVTVALLLLPVAWPSRLTFSHLALWLAVVLAWASAAAVPVRLTLGATCHSHGHIGSRAKMDCEVLAIGTELLLGQIVDTNSAWMGEHLAAAGIACYQQTKVGDNHDRIVAALRAALARGSEVICCGGLGPTQDDITREAIAEVMGVALRRQPDLVARLKERFAGREVPEINYKQADLPVGATPIPSVGTAPGLICPVGDNVIYAVPGVPSEMREMLTNAVVPDLVRRSGQRATIRSRFLRVWGMTESKVAEVVAPRVEALEAPGADVTIAFLASATEGIRVRLTARRHR